MCTNFIVGIGFVFHEWRIYNKSTWMYSSFTNLELLIPVLGCFTYGSCRNDMANYVPDLPTLHGITWLLGWGWPVSGWLEHGLSAMLMWQDDFWSRHSLHPVRQEHRQGKAQTTCTHPGRLVLGCCTLTPSNALQTYRMACLSYRTLSYMWLLHLMGALNCRTSIWRWLSTVPMEMTDISIPIFL